MRTNKIIAGLVGTFLLAGISAEATELKYFQTFTNVDYISAGVGGIREVGNGTINLTGLSGTVRKAYLYWHGHGPANEYQPARTTGVVYVNGIQVVGDLIGTSSSDSWTASPFSLTFGQAFRADVTSLVTSNGNYFLSNFTPFRKNVQGASLIVMFDDANTANNRDIVIANGCDANGDNPYDAAGWNISFPGVNYSTGDAMDMEFHVSDGQTDYLEAAIYLNQQLLAPTNAITSDRTGQLIGQVFNGSAPYNNLSGFRYAYFTGSMWDIKSFNVVPFLTPGPNSLYLSAGYEDDDLTVVAVIAKLKAGTALLTSLSNTVPTINCSAQVTRSCVPTNGVQNISQTTISDPDGDGLTLTWRINNTVIQRNTIPAGGSSTNQTTFYMTNTLTPGAFAAPAYYNLSLILQDSKGATVTCGSIITVEGDSIPPVLTCGSDLIVTANSSSNAVVPNVLGQVTATDACTPANSLVYTQTPAAGTTVGVGTTVIKVTVKDASGNVTTCRSSLTVNPYVVVPVISICTNLTTFTQGGWGADTNNLGGYMRDTYFSYVYPNGITVGGTYTLKFSGASNIKAFLPQGGTATVLTKNYINPISKISNLAGQTLSAQMCVDYSARNVTKPGLGGLHLVSGKLAGWTVSQVVSLANQVLGGKTSALPAGVSVTDLNGIVTLINQNYDNGSVDAGYLKP